MTLIFKKNIKNKYFLIEGIKENFKYNIKFKIKNIFICKKIFLYNKINKNFIKKYKKYIIYIKKYIYNKLVYRKNKEGIFFIYYKKKYYLNNINIKKNKILIILDNIEKPGNIGAIIRTLYSLNIKTIILSNYKNNIYNYNIIRSSIGYILNIKIIKDNILNIFNFLKKNKYILYITNIYKNISKNIYNINYKKNKNLAIIFGSENKGISKLWYNYKHIKINIPTILNINSLNVSIALSIIIYEIYRQKKYINKY
ncbi:MAG: TrmH family RNA methyltransferase [Candidatus Shikimatogenerans sp. Tcar]|uniref:TrmH family RNA methyltransferase n=1 Tax=Candidatus Shikimatogenerans sp. Tcar TaxID=3158565 RepID=A0AAU7QUB4_9FLAO